MSDTQKIWTVGRITSLTSLWIVLFCATVSGQKVTGWETEFHLTDSVFEAGMIHWNDSLKYTGRQSYPEPSAKPIVDELAAFLFNHPRLFVEIGVTGNPELGMQRAQWISNYAVDYGVARKRVKPVLSEVQDSIPRLVIRIAKVWQEDLGR